MTEKPRPQNAKPSQAPPQAASPPNGNKNSQPNKVAPVANLNDARQAKVGSVPSKTVTGPPVSSAVKNIPTSSPKVSGSEALSEDQMYIESQQILEMREHVRKVEFQAEVKVAVAEYKTELLSELLSDTKLMQHQVEQLLIRINAKHPDLKQEVLLIKKILADFSGKKRK